MTDVLIYRYTVLGSRKFSNFFIAMVVFLGSLAFLKTSISSYIYLNNPVLKGLNVDISFFPQGLVMGFYSILGLIFAIYSLLTFFFNIGFGFNEFNKKEKIIRLFRWGFPGKNRRIEACYSLNDVKSIKISPNVNKNIYLSLKGDIDVILIRDGFLSSFSLVEKQAIDIASFLGIPLVYS